jgi:hypothetical protein
MHEVNIRVYCTSRRYQGFVDDILKFRFDVETKNDVSFGWRRGSKEGEIIPRVGSGDIEHLLDLKSKPCIVREQDLLVVVNVFASEISIRTLAKRCPQELRYAVAPLETSAEDLIRDKGGRLEENQAPSRRLRPLDDGFECALLLVPLEPICG